MSDHCEFCRSLIVYEKMIQYGEYNVCDFCVMLAKIELEIIKGWKDVDDFIESKITKSLLLKE